MTHPRFEWFVAWRYLREQQRKGSRLLWTGVALVVVAVVLAAAARIWGKPISPARSVARCSRITAVTRARRAFAAARTPAP